MKAPEKIYLQENTTTDCYDEWWPEWFEARAKDTDIEYTRTDAFIEKACEFLYNYNKSKFKKLSPKATLDYNGYTINVKKFIEYMKGE